MNRETSGVTALCDALVTSGVECVFGLPGTQIIGLYEALRRTRLRTIVPTHELAAAFMASGYARASGKVGVLLTIPGPGFAYAIAGVAEAMIDGISLVHITIKPAIGPTGAPAFQAIDQVAIAGSLVKRTYSIENRSMLAAAIRDAIELARSPNRGCVLVEISELALGAEAMDAAAPTPAPNGNASLSARKLLGRISTAARPVILVMSDCTDVSTLLTSVAERGRVPVCLPPQSRGTVPEDNPWSLVFDDQRTAAECSNGFLEESDLVVVLGTGLSHVSTAGFRLKLPPERTVCITSGEGMLPHGYTASVTIQSDIGAFLGDVLEMAEQAASSWTPDEIERWRCRFARSRTHSTLEPLIEGLPPEHFFADLRAALPRDAVVVTDSGLHQMLVRRYFDVLSNRGLIFPCDFQSMGFGLPAAIGAGLAVPERPVILITGDGGFAMSGLEMLTAVRDKIPIVVLVMNDGKFNLIRVQQLQQFGREHGVDLHAPDFELLAAAMHVGYYRAEGDFVAVIRHAMTQRGPTIIEVSVGDSLPLRRTKVAGRARELVRSALGPRLVRYIKRRIR